MGILYPGVGAAALGNNRPEIGIGQHVDPRGRRHLAGLEGDDIFVPVAGKAAKAIRKNQLAFGKRRGQIGRPGAGGNQGGDRGLQNTSMFQLLRQSSLLIVENNSCRGLQQHADHREEFVRGAGRRCHPACPAFALQFRTKSDW